MSNPPPADPDDAIAGDDPLFAALRDAVRDGLDLGGTAAVDPDDVGPVEALASRYEIRAEASSGGQGQVFQARDRDCGAIVAIKVLPRASAASLRDRYRFDRAIELVRGLDHPGVVRVRDHGVAGQRLFCVMDWIDGDTFDVWRVGRARDDALRVFAGVCAIVHHAHSRGVIHRDLKPANVVVDADDEPHVLDFGIATVATGDPRRLTATGEFLGTLAYAAPEQVRDRATMDTRSDVHALGVVLYELLADRLPYATGGSLEDCVRRLVGEPPRPLRAPGVDRDLRTIVQTAMHKDVERRYASAEALRRDVLRYLEDRPIEARGDSLPYLLAKGLRRRRLAVGATLAALAITVSGSLAFTFWREQQRSSGTSAEVSRLFRSTLAAAVPVGLEPHGANRLMLEFAAEQLRDRALADAPAVKAELHLTLGSAYHRLWMPSAAVEQLRAALELFEASRGLDHPDTARCLLTCGRVMTDLHAKLAVEYLQRGLAIHAAHGTLDAAGRAIARSDLAEALVRCASEPDFEAANAIHRDALATLTRLRPLGDLERERAELRQAMLDAIAGVDRAEVEARLRACVARLRRHESADGALVVRGLNALVWCVLERSASADDAARQREARALVDESVALLGRVYGDAVATQLRWRLVDFHVVVDEWNRQSLARAAAAVVARSVASELRALAATAVDRADELRAAALDLDASGEAPLGETTCTVDWVRIYGLRIDVEGSGTWELARQMRTVATVLARCGHVDRAEALLELSIERIHCSVYGRKCPHRVRNLIALAELRVRFGDPCAARGPLEEAYEVLDGKRGRRDTIERVLELMRCVGAAESATAGDGR